MIINNDIKSTYCVMNIHSNAKTEFIWVYIQNLPPPQKKKKIIFLDMGFG